MNTVIRKLRRYTDLSSLFAILRNREITLLSPSSWDDRNDRNLMDAYKRTNKLTTLLALCFSEAGETYHHWKVFAPGNSGVCISFNRTQLINAIPSKGFGHSNMNYKTFSELEASAMKPEELPFTKRAAYKDEKEYRVIYQSKTKALAVNSFSIPLSAIEYITLSPWLPPSLGDVVEQVVCSIDGCADMDIGQSQLIESSDWTQLASEYA